MDAIEALPTTTFSGRRFTRNQLRTVKETVELFPNLSRRELALTVCEHLNWTNEKGSSKIQSCLTMLQGLEENGVLALPDKQAKSKRRQPTFQVVSEEPRITGSLTDLGQVRLQQVTQENREQWKGYIQAYHYLGYKHPLGNHLGYLIVSEERQQMLGCLLYSASAAFALSPRDQWIGWEDSHKKKLLNLIVVNNRFLLLPWVNVPNLATKVLSQAAKQIEEDWLRIHGYRPALLETFVDTSQYAGACYRAANWRYLGKTQGRRPGSKHKGTLSRKDVYVYPLGSDWRERLTGATGERTLKKKYRNDLKLSHTHNVDDAFVSLWSKVAHLLHEVAAEYDEKWQVRKRTINSLLIMMLIFRLVASKKHSYGTTIDELWDNCGKLPVPLPQKGSVAPSSFCVARTKLNETAFQDLNRRILETYATHNEGNDTSPRYTWLGHRLFAVDGSKINLPRTLIGKYQLPTEKAHYPQGLVSCLYQLQSQLPFDFNLAAHLDERVCAQKHLDALAKDDVVVYDRGYFSYVMLQQHYQAGVHPIFRLKTSSYDVIDQFFKSSETDTVATIYPAQKTRQEIHKQHSEINIVPLKMRLVKYEINGTTYCLGTTLIEPTERYSVEALKDAYHARWGIEELYKVSKQVFDVEDFHAQSERGVKQELFAHFVLVTMNRLFANQVDLRLNSPDASGQSMGMDSTDHSNLAVRRGIKVNFKNCVAAITNAMEPLLLASAKIKETLVNTFNRVVRRRQKDRPDRSYPRKSMCPESRWRPNKRYELQDPVMLADLDVQDLADRIVESAISRAGIPLPIEILASR